MIDLLTREKLKELISKQDRVCVSIHMPTFRVGRKTEQGPIRLKNLLKQAEQYLLDSGLRTPEIRAFLEPAEALLANNLFWQHQGDGLALFLSSAGLLYYRVPIHFDELVVATERFHVKPLFRLFTGDGRFFVLAISQNAVRLLECTRYSYDALDLEEISTSMEQALQFDDPEKQSQFHTSTSLPGTGSQRSAIFHGHAGGVDDAKSNILRFFQKIDKGLRELLRDEQAPLVLAGVEYLLPIYREANNYPHLIQEGIEGNPENLSDEKLHQQAWEIIDPLFSKAQEEALMQYQRLSNSKNYQASNELKQIASASFSGRVETLLVATGIHQWGVFDPETSKVQLHMEAKPGDEDLLDFAAVQTFLNKGTVFALDPTEMPDDSAIAAIFRY